MDDENDIVFEQTRKPPKVKARAPICAKTSRFFSFHSAVIVDYNTFRAVAIDSLPNASFGGGEEGAAAKGFAATTGSADGFAGEGCGHNNEMRKQDDRPFQKPFVTKQQQQHTTVIEDSD